MLRKSVGNMYPFVTHTWNPIKGKCPHDCSYCYMKRFPQPLLHLDEKDLKSDLGKGNKIFVGSSTDMFAENIPEEWIIAVFDYAGRYDNTYYFQSKNPNRIFEVTKGVCPDNFFFGTTIETNRLNLLAHHSEAPINRFEHELDYVSIEPIMDFDLDLFVRLIKKINPKFISIGADSRNSKLPEPSKEKILALIKELSKFTKVIQKDNLKRLLK